jgi:hypothetical protein
VSWNRDRDFDGVPDWQEEENYADEAPVRGHNNPRARMGAGCALPLALVVTALGALARRSAAHRRR